MPIYNPITGLKRKLARFETSRKKRETTCSTVSSRMLAQQAMEMFSGYMSAANLTLAFMLVLATTDAYRVGNVET
jgi:hypothetical protein